MEEPFILDLQVEEIEEVTMPSRTYQVKNGRIIGHVDGIEAIRQAVDKLLKTQLFEWEIYSEMYGVETDRLIGQDFDFVKADIERTMADALEYDDRIEGIEDFEITKTENDSMYIRFTVITNDGAFTAESEVVL